MKILIAFLFLAPLLAQDAKPPAEAKPAEPAKAAEAAAKVEEAKPAGEAKPKEEAKAASPVPTGEGTISGFIELGYRWRTDVAGSFETYRSIVNLGSGPKLLGTEFTINDPKHRLFDRLDVRAYDWGGDPYSSLMVGARKGNLYRLDVSYRGISYFDNLPSFADPSLARGSFLNEQSFDTRRKLTGVNLELLPGNWLIPYLAFDHEAQSGTGVATFVSNTNEYPFLTRMNDRTESYRGGLRMELRRFHVTLEQGGTTFRSDQNTFVPPGGVYLGSLTTPVNGHTLDLTSLYQSYGIRGSSIYSKALMSAHATSWLDFTGQFLYSIPSTSTNYLQYNYGSFASLNQLAFYNSEQNLLSAAAKMPHTSGSVGAEARFLRRFRWISTWNTDRLHNAGSAIQKDILAALPTQTINTTLASALLDNYSQVESNLFIDIRKGITARAGYRYVWGNANQSVLPIEGLTTHDQVSLQRNIGILGLTYRPNAKLSASGDAEIARSYATYFPTSLYEYEKFRARAAYQFKPELGLSANASYLRNTGVPGNSNDLLSHAEALSLRWSPKLIKRVSVTGTYEYASLRSNLRYLPPQTLTATLSNYWESGHTINGMVTVTGPKIASENVQFNGGGSFVLMAGTRATAYYQPVAKLAVPLSSHVRWDTEWRYYGLAEAFYVYEGFRAHLISTGLRFSR